MARAFSAKRSLITSFTLLLVQNALAQGRFGSSFASAPFLPYSSYTSAGIFDFNANNNNNNNDYDRPVSMAMSVDYNSGLQRGAYYGNGRTLQIGGQPSSSSSGSPRDLQSNKREMIAAPLYAKPELYSRGERTPPYDDKLALPLIKSVNGQTIPNFINGNTNSITDEYAIQQKERQFLFNSNDNNNFLYGNGVVGNSGGGGGVDVNARLGNYQFYPLYHLFVNPSSKQIAFSADTKGNAAEKAFALRTLQQSLNGPLRRVRFHRSLAKKSLTQNSAILNERTSQELRRENNRAAVRARDQPFYVDYNENNGFSLPFENILNWELADSEKPVGTYEDPTTEYSSANFESPTAAASHTVTNYVNPLVSGDDNGDSGGKNYTTLTHSSQLPEANKLASAQFADYDNSGDASSSYGTNLRSSPHFTLGNAPTNVASSLTLMQAF